MIQISGKKKTKLLFAISQFHKGGAESSLLHLLQSLDKDEFETDFIIMSQEPVKGAVSLVPDIPEWIRTLDLRRRTDERGAFGRVLYNCIIKGDEWNEDAVRFVEGKQYDFAVHVGEWWTPDFVAKVVNAKKKIIWIHTDINRDINFNSTGFFAFDELIDAYLFVSKNSMDSSCNKYPFIARKAFILHNSIDRDEIIKKSNEASPFGFDGNVPAIVTLANLRREKNHIRALEAMNILKKEGLDFLWINIGQIPNSEETNRLMALRDRYGLSDRFVLTGALSNPYPVLKKADALACLSDYESWSLTITEAKCLGVPIIATKTSGALEQIKDGESGTLCDFSAEAIAQAIRRTVFDEEYRESMRNNLQNNLSIPDALAEFRQILQMLEGNSSYRKRDVLFVIDDVNYNGGAHQAAFTHINCLTERGLAVDIYSPTWPNCKIREKMERVSFFSFVNSRQSFLSHRRLLTCLLSGGLSFEEKKARKESFSRRKKLSYDEYWQDEENRYLIELAENYKYVVVLSEGSRYKSTVAKVQAAKKIQWIHTDYVAWHRLNEYSRSMSENDESIWNEYDRIVVLSEGFVKPLSALYPSLTDKIRVVGNIIDSESIITRSQVPSNIFHRVLYCDSSLDNDGIKAVSGAVKRLLSKGCRLEWCLAGLEEHCIEEIGENEYQPALNFALKVSEDYFNSIDWDVIVLHNSFSSRKKILGLAEKYGIPVIEIKDSIQTMDDPEVYAVVRDIADHAQDYISEKEKNKAKIMANDDDTLISEPGNKIVEFVSCFRFEPIKNALGIIRTLGKLEYTGCTNYHWTFIGDGEDFFRAGELVKELKIEKRVTFLGSQSNPFPWIKKADVFVQFSSYEGLPNTIYEALVLHKPVLSTNVGAVRNQVTDSKTGWLIEPTEKSLFSALLHILNNPAEIAYCSQNLAAYEIDNESTVDRLMALFDKPTD